MAGASSGTVEKKDKAREHFVCAHNNREDCQHGECSWSGPDPKEGGGGGGSTIGRGLTEKVLGLGQRRGGVPPPPPLQPPKLSNTPRGHTLAGGRPRDCQRCMRDCGACTGRRCNLRERNLKLAEEQRARKEAGDTQPRAEEAQRCKAQEELEYKRRQAEKAAAELWKAEERQVEESASNTEESPPPPPVLSNSVIPLPHGWQ